MRFGFLYKIYYYFYYPLGLNLTPHLIFYPRFLCNKNLYYFNEIRQIGQQNNNILYRVHRYPFPYCSKGNHQL